MPESEYRGRRAASIENERLRVTVTREGGHIAEIADKATGVNPLWTPPWPTIEPSRYRLSQHPEYGNDSESKLLAGILGHNLCMDIFGSPSEDEAAAGLTVHGEASVAQYRIESTADEMTLRADFPASQLRFERTLKVRPNAPVLQFVERVENLSPCDRPIAWTEHVTLGPPFLEKGSTQFRASATRSKVFDTDFSEGKGYMRLGAEFDWPYVPRKDSGLSDLRVFTDTLVSAGFTTHLMDPARESAWFIAYSPASKIAFAYVWRRSDFPWLGIWEENYCRELPPWNGKTLTRGMEFSASPMPETRREMIERNGLFGFPGYRWIPGGKTVEVRYCALMEHADRIPESVSRTGDWDVRFEG